VGHGVMEMGGFPPVKPCSRSISFHAAVPRSPIKVESPRKL